MQKNNTPVIFAKNIIKKFGSKTILNGIDFDMPAGKIYAICGANGSGKSVFLRILVGLIRPTQGQINIFGQSIGSEVEFPVCTGALIDHPGFLKNKSGVRNLQLLAKISGKTSTENIYETMRFVGLDPKDQNTFKTYSVGMRQRLGLAQAIMENPKLLILDEPTAGLDFNGQRDLYNYLIELRKQGKTILITSHSESEVKLLCDKAYLLTEGKLKIMEDIEVEDIEEADEARF